MVLCWHCLLQNENPISIAVGYLDPLQLSTVVPAASNVFQQVDAVLGGPAGERFRSKVAKVDEAALQRYYRFASNTHRKSVQAALLEPTPRLDVLR